MNIRKKVTYIVVVMVWMLLCVIQMPSKMEASSVLRYSLKGYDLNDVDDDYEVEDAIIYAKNSITKHIGDDDFDIDNGIYSDGPVSYKSSNKKVLTVDKYGSVKIKGCGKATVKIFVDETDKILYGIKEC